MKQLTSKRSRFEYRRRGTAVLAVLSCSMVLVACRSGGVMSGPVGLLDRRSTVELSLSASRTASIPVRTGQTEQTEQIVSAWTAAQRAFETAAHAPSPSEPDLVATTISPQIDWTESTLTRMRTADEMALGPVQFGTPDVVDISSRQATVIVCAHDAEIVVSARTDQPVDGIDGQVENERFMSIMERTNSGWKLANQVVGAVACDPA
jgi:hypothetical protein